MCAGRFKLPSLASQVGLAARVLTVNKLLFIGHPFYTSQIK